jgi:hypothetical protein
MTLTETEVEAVRPWFAEAGVVVPAVRISTGFTSKGLRSNRIGECWYPEATADGVPAIFVHPKLGPGEVEHVIVHELVHAALGGEAKHGPAFKKLATALGLTGRMTATVPGPDFDVRLAALDLAPYPHAVLRASGGTSSGPPKQSTRMLKVQCETDGCPAEGYTARTTQKWLDHGTPSCPACQEPMTVA